MCGLALRVQHYLSVPNVRVYLSMYVKQGLCILGYMRTYVYNLAIFSNQDNATGRVVCRNRTIGEVGSSVWLSA